MKVFTTVSILAVVSLLWIGCTDAEDDAEEACSGICPPTWIHGVWEGGSPTTLHLEFTEDNVFNSNGGEEFRGYTETTNNSSAYSLKRENEISRFTKVSATAMDWYVTNGTIQNTTRMRKQ